MISVIIPTYNYARYLTDAVISVSRETIGVQIIIVNDGSTDNTDDVVTDLCRPFKLPEQRIKYINLGCNNGVSVARNRGLKESLGEYITFLDADDMRVPGSLELQRKFLDDHKKYDVVWGQALEIRGDIGYNKAVNKIRSLRVHPSEVNPQTVMYRRSVFERFGGWYEGLTSGEDKEMSMRLGIHPESPFNLVKAKKLKSPIAFYRKHPLEKHKLRKADTSWKKLTKRIQKIRLNELGVYGVTRENTAFPI